MDGRFYKFVHPIGIKMEDEGQEFEIISAALVNSYCDVFTLKMRLCNRNYDLILKSASVLEVS